jgi:hypothetical protein
MLFDDVRTYLSYEEADNNFIDSVGMSFEEFEEIDQCEHINCSSRIIEDEIDITELLQKSV